MRKTEMFFDRHAWKILLGVSLLIGFFGVGDMIGGASGFQNQGGPVTFALIVVVGAWLVITGYLGRSTGKLPHSLLVSIVAVPYFGYPVWAIWQGRHLWSGRLIEQSN